MQLGDLGVRQGSVVDADLVDRAGELRVVGARARVGVGSDAELGVLLEAPAVRDGARAGTAFGAGDQCAVDVETGGRAVVGAGDGVPLPVEDLGVVGEVGRRPASATRRGHVERQARATAVAGVEGVRAARAVDPAGGVAEVALGGDVLQNPGVAVVVDPGGQRHRAARLERPAPVARRPRDRHRLGTDRAGEGRGEAAGRERRRVGEAARATLARGVGRGRARAAPRVRVEVPLTHEARLGRQRAGGEREQGQHPEEERGAEPRRRGDLISVSRFVREFDHLRLPLPGGELGR